MMTYQRDPTQEKSFSPSLAEFTGKVLDNEGQEHDLSITYEWTNYWDGSLSCWSFDYSPGALPSLSARDLCSAVRDLIREDAHNTVTFY